MITVKREFKKPFFKELVLFFPILSNYKVTIVIAENIDQAGMFVADRDYLKEPQCLPGTEAFTTNSTSGYSTIHLVPDAKLGTIAHEAYHAVCALLAFVGAKEEHEVVAYHLGYLVDKIVEFNLKVSPEFERRKQCPVTSAAGSSSSSPRRLAKRSRS